MRTQRFEIPFLLKLLGCFEAEWPSYRFRWCELWFQPAFSFGYSVYHEHASLHIGLIFFTIYLQMPMLIRQRLGTEDWMAHYGFTVVDRAIQFTWRTHCKIVHFPWDWVHVRRTVLRPDGAPWKDEGEGLAGWIRYEQIPDALKERHRYNYLFYNGDVQTCTATIYGEEREWRWRWLKGFAWAPKKVVRSIVADFSEEMGERRGSWKGGVLGTGFDWREGETMQSALRKMEREVRFER